MFCISTCALYVRTQQNALCHAHLPSVTQSLNYNLGVGEKKRIRVNTVTLIVLFRVPDFKASAVNQLNSILSVCLSGMMESLT